MCKHEAFAAEDFEPTTPATHPANECEDPWDFLEECDICGSGEAFPLGSLGRLSWYRCADCGAEFSRNAW